jgi:hypothetical protein
MTLTISDSIRIRRVLKVDEHYAVKDPSRHSSSLCRSRRRRSSEVIAGIVDPGSGRSEKTSGKEGQYLYQHSLGVAVKISSRG